MDVMGRRLGALMVVLTATAAAAPAAQASLRTDVRPTAVTPAATATVPGGPLVVRWSARRTGGSARRATLVFRLSADRRADRRDVVLGRVSLTALTRRRRAAGRATLRVPAATRPATYYVLACSVERADRRSGNDCRAAARRVTIRRAASPPAPGSPSGLGAAPTAIGAGAGAASTRRFPMAASPLGVSVRLEGDSSVTAVVGPRGASLSAVAEDGTAYALELPADAVAGPTPITMTPVAELRGAPLSALVGAVRLEPEGLVLGRLATLTITPADELPGSLLGFGATGDGRDLHPTPGLSVAGGEATLELAHFSVHGAGSGDGSGFGTPAAAEAQFEQALHDAIRQQRDTTPVAEAYFRDIIEPALLGAMDSDAAAIAAVQQALAWAHQMGLAGAGLDPFLGRMFALIDRITQRMYDRNLSRCIERHDITAVKTIIGLARQRQLLGMTEENPMRDARRCLTFELDFDSDLELDGIIDGQSARYDLHVAALDVPVGLQGLRIAGAGPLAWIEASGSQRSANRRCNVVDPPKYHSESGAELIGTQDGLADVLLLADLSPRMPGTPPGPPPAAALQLGTGPPVERYRSWYTGECGNRSSEISQSLWFGHFATGVPDVLKGEGGAATITLHPGAAGSALLWRTTIVRAGPPAGETTSVEVWHRPPPA